MDTGGSAHGRRTPVAPRGRRVKAVLIAAAAVLAVFAALTVVIVVLPGPVVDRDLAGARIGAAERLGAVNNVRTTLLQAVGGAVVLFGAYATWRQLRVSQEGLNATREGHITDRFSRAVDQLGSEKLDVRIGGLYALWRIADHSAHDREAVVSIMAAFLRTHLPWPPRGPESPAAQTSINSVPPLETRAADAQVALTGLGVLCQDRRPDWLNLSYTDLRRADCDGLWLHHMNFDGACMEAASIYRVNLTGASLIAADMRHVELGTSILHRIRCIEADLRGARMVRADLGDADFSDADLREANLRKARCHDAKFTGADLRLADLRGTDLTGADLTRAALEGALASDLTLWPVGFDIQAAGVVMAEDPGGEPSILLPAAALTRNVPPLRSV
ncbi:pentapeptide repeat-containing protein [Streptomyces sp. NBC_00190]|uniref:pentapeptide repeat-containing protein n=1 Tax=unclassified Streptomyces TaxID=2593676 RepID=UPI002E2B020E|nr:pentapeptide repeat-containing protein [Streptomyces sp. NBC_00190]WSZ38744.1 pentapeptide repeat-containing protein [Streptomyces sp. NBC_00868]